ncbi:YlqD family protein [Brevibacillus ginsengisoli]|uniref:YlqD family protein n=1 Tax=Brevibacillus ginsengisoli TaxID=363854 RepID=UPI003CEE4F51
MITIHRPVQVKIVLTENSRQLLLAEYHRQIKQLSNELDQWEFQGRKLLSEAQKKTGDSYKYMVERISREERIRKEKLEILQFQIKQVENLPEGSEIFHTTVESSTQVQIGDSWEDIMDGTEIILKDGVVIDIRRGGKST